MDRQEERLALEALLLELVPADGAPIGGLALKRLFLDVVSSAGGAADEVAFERVRQALIDKGLVVRGRGGSVRRAEASGDGFSLAAREKPAPAAVPATGQGGKRKSARRTARSGEAARILSYRHTDRRRNNPEVGMVNESTDPDAGGDRYLVRERQVLKRPDILAIKGLSQFERFPAVVALGNLIENWHLSDFHISRARPEQEAGYAEHLSREGDNLSLVVEYLYNNHRDVFDRILERLRARVPGITSVDAKTTEEGRVLLRFQDGAFEDPFLARFVSDGTIKMLAYLVLLHDPTPHPLLCVEEPENQLYPSLLWDLAEEFRAYAVQGGRCSFPPIHQIFKRGGTGGGFLVKQGRRLHESFPGSGRCPDRSLRGREGSDGIPVEAGTFPAGGSPLMKTLVFLLEEPSARDALEGLLPNLLTEEVAVFYIVFEGKQDLEKRMARQMRAWLRPDSRFIVMRDQDSGDCRLIKQRLEEKCREAGRPDAIVRIACRELESWFIGDWEAIGRGFPNPRFAAMQNKAIYRDPDRLGSPVGELRKKIPDYQKRDGARRMSPHLNPLRNRSQSFRTFTRAVQRLSGEI